MPARKPRRPPDPVGAASRIDITRIRLDADGYDSNGAYYGAGQPVFLVTWPDGAAQAIRAASLKAAWQKAEAAFAAGTRRDAQWQAAAADRAAHDLARKRTLERRTATYETAWSHPLTGERRQLVIKHTRDYLGSGEDHLEIESRKKGEPHPLSDTGYRSHFVKGLDLINTGGPVVLVDRLLVEAMREKGWLAREEKRRQGDLFQWADARDQTTAAPMASKPAARARPSRGRRPGQGSS